MVEMEIFVTISPKYVKFCAYSGVPNNWGGLFFGGEIDNPPIIAHPPIIRLVIFSGTFVRVTDFSFGHVC